MNHTQKDLGLGSNHEINQKRSVNKDGTFNVKKNGAVKGIRNLYQHLISINRLRFLISVSLTYVGINLIFALAYFLLDKSQFSGLLLENETERFLACFFFSTQTFATVGYGAIAPLGFMANVLASLESFVGLLSFALATGLLFGRFSKPNAKFIFSEKILISPYKENVNGLMFRVVNKRENVLLEASAEVILTYYYNDESGEEKRDFERLELEINEIKLFPTSWTIVHPISKESPFYDKNKKELEDFKFEILVLVKAYDETFAQNVYARSSYITADLMHGAKFGKPYFINEKGETELDLNTIGDFTLEEVNPF